MILSAQSQRDLESHIDQLRQSGAAFAVATVVRTVDAISARPGGKALLDGQGTLLEGWIGGGCARTAVSKAAREAIATGRPQFVSLRPEQLLDAEGVVAGQERDGVRFARNGCPSQGSMDVFVEPVLPRPRLIICGAGPVAVALADLAARFDFHRILCAPGADTAALPQVEQTLDSFAFGTPDPDGRAACYVVIATQGQGDEAALSAALSSNAAHVAFVGSHRKFATLTKRLTSQGVDPAALARIDAPAGLDIHAITPDEIALSILADITRRRRSGDRPGGSA